MSNTRFYIFAFMALIISLQIRSVLYGADLLFNSVSVSLLDDCLTITHSFMRSLAISYTPITIVVIFAIYMPLQSRMVEKIAAVSPKYKELLELRSEDPKLSMNDAIALSSVSRWIVCGLPILKIAIHISFFYFFLFPLVTLSPAIVFETPLLFSLIATYWLTYLVGNWKDLHNAYKQISFHIALAITILMIFIFPHGLTLYFVVSAFTDLLLNKNSQRVFYSDKQKRAVQS